MFRALILILKKDLFCYQFYKIKMLIIQSKKNIYFCIMIKLYVYNFLDITKFMASYILHLLRVILEAEY